MNYTEFLESKRFTFKSSGFEPTDINPMLFDFQRDIVSWACKKGRAALFEDCGLGKSPQQLEWGRQVCNHTGGNVLILAPLAVSKQTKREGDKFGIPVTICRSQADVKPGINITNYEMLQHFDPESFAGIVLDECFPPDTLIDVVNDAKELQRREISDMMVGDTIINAGGIDVVTELHKKQIDKAVRIVSRGAVISSENHPFFTMRGWRSAKDIRPGDYIMETSTAMRLVRGGVLPEIHGEQISTVLRDILLSEMENDAEGCFRTGSFPGSGSKEGQEKERVVQGWISKGIEGDREASRIEQHGERGVSAESFADFTGHEPQTYRAWGKRNRDDRLAEIHDGITCRELESGICYFTGKTESGLPDMLQGRHRESRYEDCDRNRREQSSCASTTGYEKGCYAGFVRVESVEVLERTSERLDKYRDENGNVYFYDIKAKRHPSFSINGMLVHNSAILKNYSGKIRNEIIDAFRNTPYKLSCTATPAPNDYMELGNQCEFLGVMTRVEMLATFFVHDGGDTAKWRLKGHAEDKFWEWISSWAVVLSKPADLGYDDGGFELPPLTVHEVMVEAEPLNEEGQMSLFADLAQSLTERRQARRNSLGNRVEAACNLVNEDDTGNQWLVWCDLNDESKALADGIPGSVEVRGSDSNEHKETSMIDFASSGIRTLVSKPSIAGLGMNWQNCSNMIFVGLSDSYEMLYQAIRRCWRFGQTQPVDVYMVISEQEGAVKANIERKERDYQRMFAEMVKHTKDILTQEVHGTLRVSETYRADKEMRLPGWVRSEGNDERYRAI